MEVLQKQKNISVLVGNKFHTTEQKHLKNIGEMTNWISLN